MTILDNKFFEKLIEKVQPYFEEGGSHSFDHTQRVLNSSIKISEGEKVDLDVVKAAAILHDVARLMEDNNKIKCHAEEGAKIAEKILKELNFPNEKISKVSYAIKVHRHSTDVKPETKEAEILQDADRLDALGALTIGRMFSTGGKFGTPMHNPNIPIRTDIKQRSESDTTINAFHSKILKLKPETFKTKKAKELARGRYKFVKEFLDRFVKEWGEKIK